MRAAALTLLPMLACSGSTPAPTPSTGPSDITLLVSSRVEAELEPCG